jgi:DNA invertase Pin-like site-specific DNA recombinase
MGERARLWQRVSTAGQDEASQLPDLKRWSDTHNYEYDMEERYVIHGKSAYHKKQAAALEGAISDMANGQYTVLVVWAFDRIQRGSALEAFMLAEKARAAGGRIEYALDSYLNETNEMSDVMLALAATTAQQESKRKSERINIKLNALRAQGSAIGKPPWGYEVHCTVCDALPRQPGCRPHKKIFRPTDEGRRFVPQVFQMAIGGKSLRAIAEWLTTEGAGGKTWHQDSLSRDFIRNPIYYGQRRNGGQLETKGLVSYSVWQQAGAALSSRRNPGRGARDKALVSPVCGNPRCDATGAHPSPMYRINSRGWLYYRCHGRGPQAKGCGNMVPLAELDDIVIEARTSDHIMMHVARIFVPGDEWSDDIGKLREEGAEAMKHGDYNAATECMKKAAKLEALPRLAPHWKEIETEQTEGEYFAALDLSGRRQELAQNWTIWACKDSNGQTKAVIGHKSFDPKPS